MSQPPVSETEPLQFETAETAEASPAPGAWTCANCNQSLISDYYEAGGRIVCPACRTNIATALADRGGKERLILAAVYGTGAALLGALLWWGVRAATGYELGLIAVAVGFMVGYAVRAGAQGRGGRRFQIMAVLLTYVGVSLNYVPDIVKAVYDSGKAAAAKAQEAAVGDAKSAGEPAADKGDQANNDGKPAGAGATKESDKPVSLVHLILFAFLVLGYAAAAPFLAGASNVIGILIIGFALWEAWKMNRAVEVVFSGPFQVAPSGAVETAAPAPASL